MQLSRLFQSLFVPLDLISIFTQLGYAFSPFIIAEHWPNFYLVECLMSNYYNSEVTMTHGEEKAFITRLKGKIGIFKTPSPSTLLLSFESLYIGEYFSQNFLFLSPHTHPNIFLF